MAGALPPSSITVGLRYLPASDARMDPTAVEPVKLIFFTKGCDIRVLVIFAASSGRWYNVFKHPGGRPAACRIEAMAHYISQVIKVLIH